MSWSLTSLGPIPFTGTLVDPENVSGAAIVGEFLLLVCDETTQVDVLQRDGHGYTVGTPISLGKANAEPDLEAIATDGNTVYAIGSHSRARAKLKPGETYAQVCKKIATIKDDTFKRDALFRFTLGNDGTVTGPIEKTNLRALIEASPVLAPFAAIPSKENGIDIEGLAVRDGRLYVGFRGPVLRGNFVPVMVTKFGKAKADLPFVKLGGRGIRDLEPVADGFLVLAGPVGEGSESFRIYFWNGGDCLPGADPQGTCEYLCDVPAPDGGKPEGIALVKEDDSGFEFILLCDGVTNGKPTAYRLESD